MALAVPTTNEVEADSRGAFEIERLRLKARGIDIPDADWVYRVYALGFAAGANWGLAYAKRVYTERHE